MRFCHCVRCNNVVLLFQSVNELHLSTVIVKAEKHMGLCQKEIQKSHIDPKLNVTIQMKAVE